MSGQTNLRFRPFRADLLDAEINRRVLTNDEVGALIDVPEKSIRRWRSGKTQPYTRNVRRLAEALHVAPDYFYTPAEPERDAA